MRPYSVSLRIEAIEATRALARRDRENIYRFAHSLVNNPFQTSDNTEYDSQGRLREIKIIGDLSVVYYVDDADREAGRSGFVISAR